MAEESRYVNRELSWLEFNQRVLDEAACEENPPLERLKFVAISSANLDEFFMVRVGGLRQLAASRSASTDPTGMSPSEQLAAIHERTHRIVEHQYGLLHELGKILEEVGMKRLAFDELSDRQARHLDEFFESEVFGVVTPIAASTEESFPLLTGLTMNLCVRLAPAVGEERERFAVIPLGRHLPRFVTLPAEGGYQFVLLEDTVRAYVERFFTGVRVLECVPFRITMNADLALQEDMAGDLLTQIREVLNARKDSDCARLEIESTASPEMLQYLTEQLEISAQDIYSVPGPLDLSAFMRVSDLRGFDRYRFEPWPPQPSPAVDPTIGMFDNIRQGDILLYHPYESYEPVVRMIQEAAADPDVLAIKQTLYRTSGDSPIVTALAKAAERGKSVTVVVELKARFDEARNIAWAKNLERAGVQVIHGVRGFKTHAKVCVIVRREPHGIQRYCHFGTGNYNEITARLYSDASLLTADDDLCSDAVSFFNAITGYSQPQDFRKIEAAPLGLREQLIELIEGETERSRQGQRARITAKMNSLVDTEMIDALYAASEAGVRVQLNIRGICCLRPGVPGLSENIQVISIVDRFLEHARIFSFRHGGDERVYISSADWMPRNLDRRVELLIPVETPKPRRRLQKILGSYFKDNVKARELLADGTYRQLAPDDQHSAYRSQEVLYQAVLDEVRAVEFSRRTAFEPHLPDNAEA